MPSALVAIRCVTQPFSGKALRCTHGQCVATAHCVQDDLELINRAGQGRVDVTVGSALDLFGGPISYTEVVFWHLQQRSSS